MQFLLSTLLLATALAAPAPVSNTATCSIEYKSYLGTWTVDVGRPYLNGEGCDYVKEKIDDQILMSSSPGFKCKDDGAGMTRLEFSTNTKTSAEKVNTGLQDAYPMIPFVANNICWEYSP